MQNLAGFLLCMEKEDVKPMDTNTEFLRREDIETHLMVSRTTLYRWIESHGFPRPIKLGGRENRWYRSEVEEWLKNRPRADIQSNESETVGAGR